MKTLGMFNLLRSPIAEVCRNCGHQSFRVIQFHFGPTLLREYHLGERLDEDIYDEGEPGLRRVVVQGIGSACPDCGFDDDRDYEIFIENDIITSVRPDNGGFDYLSQGRYYWLVIEQ